MFCPELPSYPDLKDAKQGQPWFVIGWTTTKELQSQEAEAGNVKPLQKVSCLKTPVSLFIYFINQLQLDSAFHLQINFNLNCPKGY